MPVLAAEAKETVACSVFVAGCIGRLGRGVHGRVVVA